jgi:hypothetical protein
MLHRVYNEGLHHGELRLWNPHLFCGYPLYYDTLLHPFYPPNLIFHAVLPPRVAYDLLLLLHFFFSRAYLVSRALQAADDEEALQILKSSGFQARTSVVLQEVAELPRTAEGAGTVTWTSSATDRLELQVQAAADAILVVSETWDAGWLAEIDGKETPLLKANLAFRALAVPAGAHRIVMRFRPPSARNGLLLTGAAIAGVVGFCCRRKQSAS